MHTRSFLFLSAAVLLATRASAQCAAFSDEFGAPGVNGRVDAQVVFDDGAGPALFVGGDFASAGALSIGRLAKWDGSSWSAPHFPAGEGFDYYLGAALYDLEVFDDGSGLSLFAAGTFTSVEGIASNYVAKWDGSTWHAMTGLEYTFGGVPAVRELQVFDDGGGPALFAAGNFSSVNGVNAQGLAKWNGASWSAVGGGLGSEGIVMEVFDDGGGAALYIGHAFGITRWNGTSFSSVGGGVDDWVASLAVFDDGTGPALYVGGQFDHAGGIVAPHIAKWDSTGWSSVGVLAPMNPQDLLAFDDGSGPALFAACRSFSGVPVGGPIAQKLVGGMWTDVSGGSNEYAAGYDLCAWDDGSGAGPQLYMGGFFSRIGQSRMDGVAKLEGGAWTPLELHHGKVDEIDALAAHDDGAGLALFSDSGDYINDRVERWDGAAWTQVGAPFGGDVRVLRSYGGALYAGGTFDTVGGAPIAALARFNGGAWEALGSGLGGSLSEVHDLMEFDFGAGPVLVVGGKFTSAGGNTNCKRIATWDGTNWGALGSGFNHIVRSLAAFDDGGGPRLYAGGRFASSGGAAVAHIARWNGAAWEALGQGANDIVDDMVVYDDGGGAKLYCVGDFTSAGGQVAYQIARWDGLAWSPMPGGGSIGPIRTAAVFDDGAGEALFIGGPFIGIGGTPIRHLARWNGAAWTEVAGGVTAAVNNLLVFDRARASDSLFVAGDFSFAGEAPSIGIAELAFTCPCPPNTYCAPKMNSQGCAPSIFATGASSFAANNFRVKAANVLNNKNGRLFWGFGPRSSPFQGGTLCVAPPTIRTPVQDSDGNAPPDDCSGTYSFHFSASYMTAQGLAPGDRVYCQYWSRDPASASATGLTDALAFLVCP